MPPDGLGSTAAAAIEGLWKALGGTPEELDHLSVAGSEPVLPSIFRLGTAAASCVGVTTLMCARLLAERSRASGDAHVDMGEAAVAFRSEQYLSIEGRRLELWDPISGNYISKDERWVRLHANFKHHKDAILRALRLRDLKPEAVAEAVSAIRAEEVVVMVEREGGCAEVMRSRLEWLSHPQAHAVAGLPIVSLEPIAVAPIEALAPADRPLGGVRVLDLTRVIAGPVCGRTLAAHGADVLHVTAEHLDRQPKLALDMDMGKRSCQLDLRADADHRRLLELVRECDVVVQSYRPGALAALGLDASRLAMVRPGLIYISISAYGAAGPWRLRRGFDSLVQMATGIAAEQSEVANVQRPMPLPAQALDHGAGWLAAAGAVAALRRRSRIGGSWKVDVSLAGIGNWLDHLGRLEGGLATSELLPDTVQPLLLTTETYAGSVMHVRMPGTIDGQRPGWERPSPDPMRSDPRW